MTEAAMGASMETAPTEDEVRAQLEWEANSDAIAGQIDQLATSLARQGFSTEAITYELWWAANYREECAGDTQALEDRIRAGEV